MSRFYARLQELKVAKQEDDQMTTTTDAATRSKDRKRIKTALRRLLADRLFPEEAKSKRSKTAGKQVHAYQPAGDDLASGTITPLTLGSRSKTNLSTRADGSTRATTRISSQGQGRVVFVSEHSHLTIADGTVDKQPSEQGEGVSNEEHDEFPAEEPVAYYRRHPLGTLKHGQISRLYQPPAGPQRAKTSLSQTSIRQGLRNDKAFLQRLKGDQGIRAETRWSVPGEYAPDRGRDEQLNPEHSTWRREKADVAWTYNMSRDGQQTGEPEGEGGEHGGRFGHLNLRGLDDWHLRKLLEELYRDKKYMDKIIETTEQSDDEEVEVSLRMEGGREYLLDRAQFWLEKGPLPPRPPNTELGYKLEKLRAKTASQTGSQSPLPKQSSSLPPGRGNSTLSSSTIRTIATTHTVKTTNDSNNNNNTTNNTTYKNTSTSNNNTTNGKKESESSKSEKDNAQKEKSSKQDPIDESNEETTSKQSPKSVLTEKSNSQSENVSHPKEPEQQKTMNKDTGQDSVEDDERVVNVYSSAESRTY